MTSTLEKLLNTAEDAVRLRGYHAVSFRELADELGIKSASVHYYFPQKEDLGTALVERYRDRFFAALEAGTTNAATPAKRLDAFIQLHREALTGSDRICLCGMLGAESCGLPAAVSTAVAEFFKANINWLVAALPKELSLAQRKRKASHIVAALQGAMMLATSLADHSLFDSVASRLSVE